MPPPRLGLEEVTIVKNLFWFVLGLAGGVIAAHVVNKDPRGHEVLAQVDARISEFTDRISSAYREQEARFAGPAATDGAPTVTPAHAGGDGAPTVTPAHAGGDGAPSTSH
jgi:hypothetical protein